MMKRRAQLVWQHLESISREALERHQEIIRQYVQGRQGVESTELESRGGTSCA